MKLVLCGDQRLFVTALGALLAEGGYEVVTCASPAAAVALVQGGGVDICVLDLGDGDNVGLRAVSDIAARSSDTRIVVSGADDAVLLARAVRAGARGVVLKSEPAERFFEVLDRVRTGQVAVPPSVVRALPSARAFTLAGRASFAVLELTDRERQVLASLVRGEDTPAIASSLGVQYSTARTHIQRVLTKLGVHSKLEAVALAVSEGLVASTEGGSTRSLWRLR